MRNLKLRRAATLADHGVTARDVVSSAVHDNVMTSKHFRVADLCEGKPPVIGEFPHKGQ